MNSRLILNALIAAGFVTAAPLALAQTADAAPAQKSQAGRHQHAQQPGAHRFALPSERVEARLAHQKAALKITAEQEARWNAYAEVVRKQAKEADARLQSRREKMAASAGGKRPGAIERLEQRQAFMAEASQRIGERLAVQKPLYAALSPEQQQIADRLFAQRGGKHGGGQGRQGRRGRA
jgi:Spy/CpxP family protein refolding chaperone